MYAGCQFKVTNKSDDTEIPEIGRASVASNIFNNSCVTLAFFVHPISQMGLALHSEGETNYLNGWIISTELYQPTCNMHGPEYGCRQSLVHVSLLKYDNYIVYFINGILVW